MGICVRDLHEICTCSKNEYKEVTELLPLEVPVGGAVQTQKGGIVSPPTGGGRQEQFHRQDNDQDPKCLSSSFNSRPIKSALFT